MIFPARNLHLYGIFHGELLHNQMVITPGPTKAQHGARAPVRNELIKENLENARFWSIDLDAHITTEMCIYI